MNNLFFILFIVLTQLEGPVPSESGIYLIAKCNRYNRADMVLITSKKVCLTDKPIIPLDDFESISALNISTEQTYFDITFSMRALEILKILNQSFPNIQLAFVVEHDVFMVFNMDSEHVNRTFRFKAKDSEMSEFIRIHHKLRNQK